MNLAHGTIETSAINSRLMGNAGFVIPLLTILSLVALCTILWLLKRYTPWNFKARNERSR